MTLKRVGKFVGVFMAAIGYLSAATIVTTPKVILHSVMGWNDNDARGAWNDLDFNDIVLDLINVFYQTTGLFHFGGYTPPGGETPFPDGYYFDEGVAAGGDVTVSFKSAQSSSYNVVHVYDFMTHESITVSADSGPQTLHNTHYGDDLKFTMDTSYVTGFSSNPSYSVDHANHAVVYYDFHYEDVPLPPIDPTPTPNPTPEPASLVMLGGGGVVLMTLGRRLKHKAK